MTFGAVINDTAGTLAGRPGADRGDLKRRLSEFVDDRYIRWAKGGDITHEARQLVREGIDVLLAGGGDGTVSAVGAIAAAHGRTLALLPLGTLNHLARDLGIPLELPEAIEVARSLNRRRIDIGQVNGRTFLNNLSVGIYPALVVQRHRFMNRRGWRRAPAYVAAGWQAVRRLSASPMTVDLDGRRTVRARPLMLFIGNNAYDGTVWSDPKRPRLDDGKLWVCMTHSDEIWPLMKACWGFIVGTLAELADVDTEVVESLTVRTKTTYVRVAVDGETCRMRSPLEVRSLPRSLEVIAP